MSEEKFGFVYKIDGDYMLRHGRNYYLLFDGIADIQTDVEIAGSLHDSKEIKGYCLRINKKYKVWQIADTGHKNCKHILVQGKYLEGFVESLKPIMRVFCK